VQPVLGHDSRCTWRAGSQSQQQFCHGVRYQYAYYNSFTIVGVQHKRHEGSQNGNPSGYGFKSWTRKSVPKATKHIRMHCVLLSTRRYVPSTNQSPKDLFFAKGCSRGRYPVTLDSKGMLRSMLLWLCICKIIELVNAKIKYIYASRRQTGMINELSYVAVW